MLPTFSDGDVIIYRPFLANESLPSSGSIVVAHPPDKPATMIIKRLHKINSTGLDLRGDNKNSSTDSRHFGYIQPKKIAGIVEAILMNAESNKNKD